MPARRAINDASNADIFVRSCVECQWMRADFLTPSVSVGSCPSMSSEVAGAAASPEVCSVVSSLPGDAVEVNSSGEVYGVRIGGA